MKRVLLFPILLLFSMEGQAQQLVLENFSTGIRKNASGSDLWSAYLGEDPDQTYAVESSMLKITGSKTTGCGTNGCGIYMHFMPYPYVGTGGFAHDYILGGTWNQNSNRLRFKFKCTKNQTRPSDTWGGSNYYIGTYVKPTNSTDQGAQGQHYYHTVGSNVYANRWVLIELNRVPQHRVGESSHANWPEDPEWVKPSWGGPVHYFDGLTRFYFDTTGDDDWSGQVCYFDDFSFERKDGEAETYVSNMTATHSGSKYEVTWNAPKNVATSFEVRYATASMKVNGFNSGTSGGTVAGPGSDYTQTFWASPNMAEAAQFYVAIRPVGQTAFTEIHIPAMNIPGGSSPCDLDSNGKVDGADVSISINRALGITACTGDLDSNGRCDVVDTQRVINTSLGGTCRVGP